MQMQKVLMHSDFFFLRRLARKIEVSGVKNIFLSQPAMKKKKRRIKKTWSSHLANAACKEQELFVTQTSAKMPKIGMIMQDQVFLYIFHSFFFSPFFPPKSDLSKCIYLYIPFYMCQPQSNLGHSFVVPSDTLWKLYPLSSRFPILPPPLLVWICSSSCVFGLGKQSCCLWVISRAQISGSFFLGSWLYT